MRVLVLGGNRYIGLSLVRELARGGFEVTDDEVLARTGRG